jgi:hypothetical protein
MKELFYKLVTGKLLLPALLVVGGIIFVLKRFVVSSVEKNSALQAIKKIKREPSYARAIADELDMPYGVKEDFRPGYFEKLKEYLAGRRMVGNYQVIHTAHVSSSELLVFALISFDDFDVGITGKGTDVRKNSYLTFLIRHDYSAQHLTVYSDTYNTSTEKFQRAGFLNAILRDSNG